jgi:hypothetical protein
LALGKGEDGEREENALQGGGDCCGVVDCETLVRDHVFLFIGGEIFEVGHGDVFIVFIIFIVFVVFPSNR